MFRIRIRRIRMFLGFPDPQSGSVRQRYGSADPDTNVTDPQVYILDEISFLAAKWSKQQIAKKLRTIRHRDMRDMDKEKKKYKNSRRTSIYTLIFQSGKIEENSPNFSIFPVNFFLYQSLKILHTNITKPVSKTYQTASLYAK